MRRIAKSVMAICIMLTILTMQAISARAEQNSTTEVLVNNKSVLGCIWSYNGNEMLPAEEFAEALGGTFKYESSKSTGTITLKDKEIEIVFKIDSDIVKLNGKYIKSPVPMKINNFRIMIPVKFTAECLGLKVYEHYKNNSIMLFASENGNIAYKVKPGDTLWILSATFGTSIAKIRELSGLTSDWLYIGQQLVVKQVEESTTTFEGLTSKSATIFKGPGFSSGDVNYLKAWTSIRIEGKIGEWYKVSTPKGDGYTYSSVTYVRQDINDDNTQSSFFSNYIDTDKSKNYIEYNDYVVQMGDSIWYKAEKLGVSVYEIASANGISTDAILQIGQLLKIPEHIIPVKETNGEEYGEILDWFEEGQYIFPIGKAGRLVDLETGKSFMVQRTMGANHSDTETLTTADTNTMKEIFGGNWTWERRPFILEVDGRKIAVSVAGMAHAGVDGVPFLENVDNRSDDWGYGPNYDRISGNGMDGHFDVYFLNCLRHKDNKIDPEHQQNVMIAGGLR